MIYMPRNDKDVTGPRGKGQFSSKSYTDKRSKQERGRFMPTFSHTRTHTKMTSFDDVDYLVANLLTFVSGTWTGAQNLAKAIVEQGHTSGHMKDKVDAEETAYAENCSWLLSLILDLRYQHSIRNKLADAPEADETGTSGSGVAIWTLSSFNNLMTEIDGKDIKVANWILALADDLSFYFKLSDEYMVGTVRTPPSYFYPFVSDRKLTETNTLLSGIYPNNALSKLYMDKFGLGYSKLTSSIITKELTEYRGFNNTKALAYFCHSKFQIYDNGGAHTIEPDGTIHDDDLASRKYYFLDKPDEDILHVIAPVLEAYVDGDTCIYGIFGTNQIDNDDDDVSLIKIDFIESSAWTECTVSNIWYILKMFAASYQQGAGHSQGDTSGWFNVSLTGSKLAADVDLSSWPLAVDLGAFYGTGITETIADNALLNYCISKAF
jgi:hypothetical protein